MVSPKKERVRAALAGQRPDRVPAGFWGHDYAREWSAESLAAAMLESFHRYDWDFLKVNPRATYYAEAFGCRVERDPAGARGPRIVEASLNTADDLAALRPVSGTEGVFAEQLQALRLIGEGIAGADYVQTVFSPLSVVGYASGRRLDAVRGWMTDAPDALHHALDAITDTLADYAAACLEAGASGIFFATTDWATRACITPEQYAEFGRPFDLRVLEAVQGAELNVLHVCRAENMLLDLLDYPVQAFNWADREAGNPSLAEVQSRTDRAVMGGVALSTLSTGAPADVEAAVHDAIDSTGGRRLLVAPGCSVPPEAPAANLQAAARARSHEPVRP